MSHHECKGVSTNRLVQFQDVPKYNSFPIHVLYLRLKPEYKWKQRKILALLSCVAYMMQKFQTKLQHAHRKHQGNSIVSIRKVHQTRDKQIESYWVVHVVLAVWANIPLISPRGVKAGVSPITNGRARARRLLNNASQWEGRAFRKAAPTRQRYKTEGFAEVGRNNFSYTAKRSEEYYNSERYLDYTLASTLWLDLNISELFLRRVDYYYLKQNDTGRSRWMQYHW